MRIVTGLIGGLVFAVGRRRSPAGQTVEGAGGDREQLRPVR
jgi:hypothetical protein